MMDVSAARGERFMRALAIAMALSSTLLAAPALARDGALYVGGEFGVMSAADMDVDAGATDNAFTIIHEYGYDGGIFVGYDFGAFRLEAEVAHKRANLDSYNTSMRFPLESENFAPQREAGGNSSALSFMVNGMLDLGDDDGPSFSIGGGVGVAKVKANEYLNFVNATPFLDGTSDWKLAWQVVAGVRQPLTDNIDITLKYRFFNADKIELTLFNGALTEMSFRSHSLLGGVTFNFGN